MKTQYRGFEIDVHREKCMAGYTMLYYSVYRHSDGWEFDSGFSDSEDTIRQWTKDLKAQIDDYYANPSDYEDGE